MPEQGEVQGDAQEAIPKTFLAAPVEKPSDNHGPGTVPTEQPLPSLVPRDPSILHTEIQQEFTQVKDSVKRHDVLAARWEAVASWNRVIVTLTSSISAISVVAKSTTIATIFAVTTAVVAAINAGFSPSDRAKQHRDASRSYSQTTWPLESLLWQIESYSWRLDENNQWKSIQGQTIPFNEMKAIWDTFAKEVQQIQTTDQTAPSLSSIWPQWPWSSWWAGLGRYLNGAPPK